MKHFLTKPFAHVFYGLIAVASILSISYLYGGTSRTAHADSVLGGLVQVNDTSREHLHDAAFIDGDGESGAGGSCENQVVSGYAYVGGVATTLFTEEGVNSGNGGGADQNARNNQLQEQCRAACSVTATSGCNYIFKLDTGSSEQTLGGFTCQSVVNGTLIQKDVVYSGIKNRYQSLYSAITKPAQCTAPTTTTAPTAAISAIPRTIPSGVASSLSWSCTNATTAVGTNFNTSGALSGTVLVSPTVDSGYAISCTKGSATAPATWQLQDTDISDYWCPVTNADKAYSGVPNCPAAPQGTSCTEPGSVCKVNRIVGCNIVTKTFSCTSDPSQSATASTNVSVTPAVQNGTCGDYAATVGLNCEAGEPVGAQCGPDQMVVTDAQPSTKSCSTNAYSYTAHWQRCVASTTCTLNAQPDLTADIPVPASNPSIVGMPVSIATTIHNSGAGATTVPVPVLFQLADANDGTGARPLGVANTTGALGAGSASPVSVSFTFPATGTYYVRACADKQTAGDTGTIQESNEDNNCSAWGQVTVSTPPPVASLVADPAVIKTGEQSTLTWNCERATSAVGNGFSTGNAVSGSVIVQPSITTTYQVTCTGTGGSRAFQATVTVVQPNLTILATPNLVTPNTHSLIAWSARQVTSCTVVASGAGGDTYTWSGSAIAGTLATTTATRTIAARTVYTLTCTPATGGAPISSSAVVNVVPKIKEI